MNFEKLKETLEKLDTSCVMDSNGSINQINPLIKPIHSQSLKLIGKALTVSCSNDFLPVLNALAEASCDDVIVVDGKGGNLALAGELFATEAKRKGLAGIVIDGAARDSASVKEIGLPFYAKSINPKAGSTKKLSATNKPIYCGGTKVKPGDIVFGDMDGLLVGSIEEFEKVIKTASEIQNKEQSALAKMNSGSSLFELLNLEEHNRAIRDSEPSKLTFTISE